MLNLLYIDFRGLSYWQSLDIDILRNHDTREQLLIPLSVITMSR